MILTYLVAVVVDDVLNLPASSNGKLLKSFHTPVFICSNCPYTTRCTAVEVTLQHTRDDIYIRAFVDKNNLRTAVVLECKSVGILLAELVTGVARNEGDIRDAGSRQREVVDSTTRDETLDQCKVCANRW